MDNYEPSREYEWYQNGISYNKRLEPSYYDVVDCNWDFFYGKQWRNAGLSDELPQPVFNFVNRYVTFFVSSIMANKTEVKFDSPIMDTDEEVEDISDDILNQSWAEFEERVKLVWKTKNALYDGAVTGDYVGHVRMDAELIPYNGAYSDVKGELVFDLVDANNFYVANPNSKEIQTQGYVQIVGRDTIANLKAEAKAVQESQEEFDEITTDTDNEQQASRFGQIEMENGDDDTSKATYIITYTKKKVEGSDRKTVHVSKSTKDYYIYQDINLETELYPVAHGNWELQRNTYRGMSFVTGMIPTQIYINRGFAMAMFNTMTTAFPKLLFNKDKISGFTTSVGGQIGAELAPGESLSNIAQYVTPGNMSAQVVQMIELATQYMRDAVGAADALLGNVNPEQASGTAISVASKQAGIPLENPRSNMYNWLEDIAKIYSDMVSHLYGSRPVIMPTENGSELAEFDFDTLQGMYKQVKIEVGPSTYWSALALKDTMDNLLANGYIEFVTYLEGMTDEFVPNRQKMIDDIKEVQQVAEEGGGDEQEFIGSLSPEEQQEFLALPPEQQQAIFEQARGGVQNEV